MDVQISIILLRYHVIATSSIWLIIGATKEGKPFTFLDYHKAITAFVTFHN